MVCCWVVLAAALDPTRFLAFGTAILTTVSAVAWWTSAMMRAARRFRAWVRTALDRMLHTRVRLAALAIQRAALVEDYQRDTLSDPAAAAVAKAELESLTAEEKRLRAAETEKDAADRKKEEAEMKEKAETEQQVAKLEEAGITPSAAMRHPEGRKLVELVNRVQAEPRDDLFRMEIDVNFLRSEKILEKKMRPWLESKIDVCMGGAQSDLVEYILRRVNGNSTPEALISDLSRYLDDNTDVLVERMWRMIGFELLCGGVAPSLLLKEK